MDLLADIGQRVSHALRFVAPTRFGDVFLADNTLAPPRYVWVRTGDTVVKAQYLDYPKSVIGQVDAAVEVHCWGKSEEQAETLRIMLINALTNHVSRDSWDFGAANWVEPEHMQGGFVCTQSVTFRLPIPAVTLPTSPNEAVRDVDAEVLITAIDHEASEVSGDGEIGCDH